MGGPRPGGANNRQPRGGAKKQGDRVEPTHRVKDPKKVEEEEDPFAHITDSMVQQLLRLQRKEWDKTPYEPKYAPGSFAANELIHTGRELFRGDVPDVKVWGRLEKRIGVVGMHGAEGRLEVRRVLSGKDEVDNKDGVGSSDAVLNQLKK